MIPTAADLRKQEAHSGHPSPLTGVCGIGVCRRWYRPGFDAECVRWLAATAADCGAWVSDGAVTGWPRHDHACAASDLAATIARRRFTSSAGALRVPS